ncbi:MAG: hypothetical protein R2761_19595 [Acidimicrobiales bacterium]
MTVDRELQDRLGRLRDAHQPDRDRIRARFEAGIAADVGPAPLPAGRRRPARAWRGVPVRAAAVMAALGLAATGAVVATRDRPASVEAGGAPAAAGVAPPYVAPTTPAATASTVPAPSLPPGTGVATTAPAGTGPVASDPAATVTASAAGPDPSVTTAGSTGVGPSAPRSPATPAGSPLCRHKDDVDLGRLHLVNDLWGAAQASSGSQCVTVTSPSSASIGADGTGLAWSTRWGWAGAPGQPKSFSNVYLGWDWGWKEADSGLPRRMSDRPVVRSSWDFTVSVETPGRMEVAYDLWFHDRPDPAGDTLPVSEVRIILYRTPGDLPATGRQGTVTLEGGTWDVYRFGDGWDVVTFYRTTPTTSADVDLGRFLDEAARYARLPWLTSIHAGVGVNDGAGQVDTSRFTLTLS